MGNFGMVTVLVKCILPSSNCSKFVAVVGLLLPPFLNLLEASSAHWTKNGTPPTTTRLAQQTTAAFQP
jgi:hypothetical protein